MAVINRTPDSFFDRGSTREYGAALEAASRAVADGADILDIGGVRAGPGEEVSPAAEIDRVAGLVIARLQPVVGQVGCEADTSWHAPVLQHYAMTPYQRPSENGEKAGKLRR